MASAESQRHKCAACFRQFNKVEHLVEHMKTSYHSSHEPICGICKKHCRFYDSLREHLIGPLPKMECAKQFSERGCTLCLTIFQTAQHLALHKPSCQSQAPLPSIAGGRFCSVNKQVHAEKEKFSGESSSTGKISAVALGCDIVGGGNDGSLDLCGRVCLIDEDERVVFQSFVKPLIPITNYRSDITGVKPEDMVEAMPLKQVRERIQEILYNGEVIWRIRSKGARAKVVVGHELDRHLQCLAMDYPSQLIRDTSKYTPLQKSNKTSNSLKDLTQSFLGYKTQNHSYNPYDHCVAAMRIYKKMRSMEHSPCSSSSSVSAKEDLLTSSSDVFGRWRQKDLEKMSPEALLKISESDFYCWCLDSTPQP